MMTNTTAVQKMHDHGRLSTSCVIVSRVAWNVDRLGTEKLVADLDPRTATAYKNDRGHVSLTLPNSSHRIRLKTNDGSQLAIAPSVVLSGQTMTSLQTELAQSLNLSGFENLQAKLELVKVTLYLQTDDSFLPPLPFEFDARFGTLLSRDTSSPLYEARVLGDPSPPEWLDTRARRLTVIHNGTRAIGFRCGSETGGLVVTACDESTSPIDDARLRAELENARGFDPARPVRELSLSFHAALIEQLAPNASDGSALEDALRGVPLYIGNLVGGAVGDGSRRPFFRFTPEGSPVRKGWRPDSPLWTCMRGTLLEAMPKTAVYPVPAVQSGSERIVRDIFPASVIRRVQQVTRMLHG